VRPNWKPQKTGPKTAGYQTSATGPNKVAGPPSAANVVAQRVFVGRQLSPRPAGNRGSRVLPRTRPIRSETHSARKSRSIIDWRATIANECPDRVELVQFNGNRLRRQRGLQTPTMAAPGSRRPTRLGPDGSKPETPSAEWRPDQLPPDQLSWPRQTPGASLAAIRVENLWHRAIQLPSNRRGALFPGLGPCPRRVGRAMQWLRQRNRDATSAGLPSRVGHRPICPASAPFFSLGGHFAAFATFVAGADLFVTAQSTPSPAFHCDGGYANSMIANSPGGTWFLRSIPDEPGVGRTRLTCLLRWT